MAEVPDRPTERARLCGYEGAVWIVGAGWKTSPGWIGPLKFWRARRWARRHGIRLENGEV